MTGKAPLEEDVDVEHDEGTGRRGKLGSELLSREAQFSGMVTKGVLEDEEVEEVKRLDSISEID